MTFTEKSQNRARPNYFTIAMDAWALAAESNMVIALRLGALASGGPTAAKEAERMVSEKVAANMALGFELMSGKLGASPEQIVSGSIAHYSRHVRRNRERLAKERRPGRLVEFSVQLWQKLGSISDEGVEPMGIRTHLNIASPIAALSLFVLASTIPAQPAAAQGAGLADPVSCANFGLHWTKAKSRGPVGRRDTLKSAMAALDSGDAALGLCMTLQFTKHYALESLPANSLNGFAPLIKEVRSNLTAVQTLPPAQQCRAATLFVDGWNAFHAKNPNVPILIHSAMTREHGVMCTAK